MPTTTAVAMSESVEVRSQPGLPVTMVEPASGKNVAA